MFEAKRRSDWAEALHFALGEHRKHAFKWGQWDCATFFSDVVFQMTGSDPFADIGRWDSEKSATKRLLKAGYLSVQAFLDNRLTQIPVSEARRGDCGYGKDVGPLSCPLIVVGSEAISRNERGFVMFPTSMLVTAYRIG